jgi:outer membrane protein
MVMGLLCLLTPLVLAQQAKTVETEPLWEWRLGAIGLYGPAYPASEDFKFNFVPLPYPIYRGKYLRIGDDNENPVSGRLFRRDRVKLDLSLGLKFPVESDDIEARVGMPDLDLLIEAGPKIEMEFANKAVFDGRWFVSLGVRPAVSLGNFDPDYQGLVFNPELLYIKKLSGHRNEVKIRLAPVFANSRYMGYFYTVGPDSVTPSRPAYKADGGYLGTDLSANWLKRLNKSYEFLLGARISSHHGAANRDSPLFTSDLNYSIFAAISWKFWESENRALELE